MATTRTIDRATYSSNPYIQALISNRVWMPGDLITYYLKPTDLNGNGSDDLAEKGAGTAIVAAYNTWAAVVNIRVQQAINPNDAVWIEQATTGTGGATHTLPYVRPLTSENGGNYKLLNVDPAQFAKGGQWYAVVLHEIGHGLGLEHTHDSGRFPGVPAGGDAALGDNGLNNKLYSLMSYNTLTRFIYGTPATPMAFDIAAVQALYGANMTTATGNDSYVLPTANAAGTFYACIWDVAGIDTISVGTDATTGATIELRAATLRDEVGGGGRLSSVTGINGGFTIANGVVIENAIGSQFADMITGNTADNRLTGNGGADTISAMAGNDTITGGSGNDTIDGGTGVDVAIYAAARSATTVTYDTASRSLSVGNAVDGTDAVRHVEQLQFSDGLYSFNFASPDGPAVANFNPANGWSSQDGFPRHVADVTGDGYGDIVGFGIGGVFVATGSAGGRYGTATLSVADFGANQGWTSDNLYHRELADVNGDGSADIVGFGISGMYVSLATTSGFGTATLSVRNFTPGNGWSSQDGFVRTLADVDGDGKADVVGFGIAGTYVALGQGDGTFQDPKLAVANFGANQGWTSDNIYHRALGDVNGDGRADIVGFGAAGVYVASGQADGTFGPAELELANFNPANGWATQDAYTRLLADVNGDGKADIVGFGQNGVFVANALGDGQFNAASFDVANFGQAQGWTSDNVFHREVFDVNHDGMADIVGFGIGGVLIALNQNDPVL